MSFFQNSVLNKHLKAQDENTVRAAYERFTAYFHDPERQLVYELYGLTEEEIKIVEGEG